MFGVERNYKMTKKLTITEQCRRAGIDRKTYYYRLKKGETDLFAPLIRQRKPKRSVPDHIKPLLKENNIPNRLYFNRLDKGWTEFEASHVLPNSFICHYHNGKTISSQLSENKYKYFLSLVNSKGLSTEEALHRINNPASSAKYYRDGMTLHAYCKKHGLSYNIEYGKLRKANCKLIKGKL